MTAFIGTQQLRLERLPSPDRPEWWVESEDRLGNRLELVVIAAEEEAMRLAHWLAVRQALEFEP